jgi:hypothetical protein
MTKWLNMGVNVSYSQPKTELNDGGRFSTILTVPVLAKAYDDNGDLLREISTSGTINPLWYNREYNNDQNDEYLVPFRLLLILNSSPGFSYKLTGQHEIKQPGDRALQNYEIPRITGEGSISNFKRSSFLIENLVTYAVPITDKRHNINLTLLQSVDQDLQKPRASASSIPLPMPLNGIWREMRS